MRIQHLVLVVLAAILCLKLVACDSHFPNNLADSGQEAIPELHVAESIDTNIDLAVEPIADEKDQRPDMFRDAGDLRDKDPFGPEEPAEMHVERPGESSAIERDEPQQPEREPTETHITSDQTPVEPSLTVYFKKPSSWQSANIHYWATYPNAQNSAWPGKKLSTSKTAGWYAHTFDRQISANFVFNDPISQAQTVDLSRIRDGWFVPSGQNHAGKIVGQWFDQNPDLYPIIGVSPPGGSIYGADLSVLISVSGPNISRITYTTDGSDPATSGQSIQNGQTITLGANLNIGDTHNLRVHAANTDGHHSASYEFTKRSPQTIRAWDPADKPDSVEQTGRFALLRNFNNRQNLNPRDIMIYLPPDYASNTQGRYRVIYFHDGQNLFDKSLSSFGMEWMVDENIDELLLEQLIYPAIVVGIYNAGTSTDRTAEYAGTKTDDRRQLYAKWVVDHLKPYIDHHYRTMPQAEYTTTMGSSYGGMISIYLAWHYPQIFGVAGCVSNAFKENAADFLATIEAYTGAKKPVRFWVDGGYEEGTKYPDGRSWYIENNRRFAEKLAALGHRDNIDLGYLEVVGADHSETAWSMRIKQILYFALRKHTPRMTRIWTRNSLPDFNIGQNAYTSVDLLYENNFRLTKTFNDQSIPLQIVSSNPHAVEVDMTKYGLLTAKSSGMSNIEATSGKFISSSVINVK